MPNKFYNTDHSSKTETFEIVVVSRLENEPVPVKGHVSAINAQVMANVTLILSC